MLVAEPRPPYNPPGGTILGNAQQGTSGRTGWMSNARRILIIDDDDELRESLSEQLSLHEEFDTELAPTAQEGLKLARNGHVDLVLLDVGLPDLDGREACKLLRRGGYKGPVIMLTAQSSDADTILGLESGANDYVTKPFRLGVLLARIRAQLRQHEQSEDAVFTIGPYTFKTAARSGSRRKRPRSSNISIAPANAWSPAMCCCTRSGAITPASPRTRSRPTSTGCARRSRKIPRKPSC